MYTTPYGYGETARGCDPDDWVCPFVVRVTCAMLFAKSLARNAPERVSDYWMPALRGHDSECNRCMAGGLACRLFIPPRDVAARWRRLRCSCRRECDQSPHGV